jgi:hypothetical protein
LLVVAVDGEYDVVEEAAQQLFAVAVVGGRRAPDAREIGGEALEGVAFAVAQRCGALALEPVRSQYAHENRCTTTETTRSCRGR